LSQRLEPINTRQPDIEQNATISTPPERFETLLTRPDRIGDETLVFHHRTQRVANATLVVNYENRIHASRKSCKS
jgi:hypothetical protein